VSWRHTWAPGDTSNKTYGLLQSAAKTIDLALRKVIAHRTNRHFQEVEYHTIHPLRGLPAEKKAGAGTARLG
jgi:hypothetical protein